MGVPYMEVGWLTMITISNGSSYLVELDLQEDVVPLIWRSENAFSSDQMEWIRFKKRYLYMFFGWNIGY